MLDLIGVVLLTVAVVLDIASYWKQVVKILRTGKSGHISTTAFMLRIIKIICLVMALSIYKNWVGVGIYILSLLACTVTLVIIAKHKPKGWHLWG